MAKAYEELELKDDFMFSVIMRDPKYVKPFLETILRIKIAKIEYPEVQKNIDIAAGAKGIRLDVYVEDEKHTVFNLEMQTTTARNLPKRMRYYQGMIDLNILNKGESYNKLKKSYVIFICNYDPFRKGRCFYRFENVCVDDPSLKLEDDSVKIMINPYGNDTKQFGKGFAALMNFLKNGQISDTYTESLKDEITEVKVSEEWRRRYMKLLIRDQENIELGKEIGEKLGKEVGKELGELSTCVRQVKTNMEQFSASQLASLLGFDQLTIEEISESIKAHPDWSNEKIATELLEERNKHNTDES